MFRRHRRLRASENLRALTQENHLHKTDLIYPLFVKHGKNFRNEIASMPGVFQLSIDQMILEAKEAYKDGIRSVMLFGIPETKDSIGSDALCDHGIIATAIKELKSAVPEMIVMSDLCFCEYTDHGHCGVIDPKSGSVANDITLENLGIQAVIHAKAGVDVIAPSGMMDGMIFAIRSALDDAGFENLPIMSYSTKFASGYYGPFRDVAESTPSYGDRKTYQMSPANLREAIEESLEDERQGADILMVKPALAYMDVVREIRNHSSLPLAVYNVSGEYAMLKCAQKAGLINYEKVLFETMIGFKRAGADIIITYHARELCALIDSNKNYF